jgi:hypothetical protein
MHSMILDEPGKVLREAEVPEPKPDTRQVKVRIGACAVCRTDLHVLDGELPHPKLPLIPGHEIVGEVIECGSQVGSLQIGDRVGIPWLGWTCGECAYCRMDKENLCDNAKFNGYNLDGGYAEFAVADERFCFRLPESYTDVEAAPLLCAGLIGYRSLLMAGSAAYSGSAPLRTSYCKSLYSKAGKFMLLQDPVNARIRILLDPLVRSGLVGRMNIRRRSWMRPSFLRPQVRLCPWLSGACGKGEKLSAAGYT